MDWDTARLVLRWAPAVIVYGSQIRQTYQTAVWAGHVLSAVASTARRVFVRRRPAPDDPCRTRWVLVRHHAPEEVIVVDPEVIVVAAADHRGDHVLDPGLDRSVTADPP